MLLVAVIASTLAASAEYVGSDPSQAVYLSQTKKHTCTLIAAAMMLRNFAELHQMDPELFPEESVRSSAWHDGLRHDFDVMHINVQCTSTILETDDRKAYLITFLRHHPEGIVIYNADQPHALLLLGYDSDTDVFYCADTTTKRAGQRIRLTDSLLKGQDQEAIIRSLDRIWYVTGIQPDT